MNDRELLELAAKAAGFYVCNDLDFLGLKEWGPGLWVKSEKYGSYELWDPLEDDGDALRLAVYLGILRRTDFIKLLGQLMGEGVEHGAATRRSIVQVAAGIGALKC